MKKQILLCFVLIFISSVTALPVYLRPLSSGNTQPSQTFTYIFNFTVNSDCTDVVYTNISSITTDKYGLGYVDLDTASLTKVPKYLCEYKNGVTRKVHTLSDSLKKEIYAQSANFSKNVSADYLLGKSVGDGSQLTGISTFNNTYDKAFSANVSNQSLDCNLLDGYDSSAFVPYSGASGNVDLGNNYLYFGLGKYIFRETAGKFTIHNDAIGDYLALEAQNGLIKLDAPITEVSGNLTVSGNVIGDGSQLTGVSTSNRFNQELNTTNNVNFSLIRTNNINATTWEKINVWTNSSFRINFNHTSANYLEIRKYADNNPIPTLFSSTHIYMAPANTLSGYFTTDGFSYIDDKGMLLGSGGGGKVNLIWALTGTQTNGTATNRMESGYLGVADGDYSYPTYQGARYWLVGDSSNRSVNRNIDRQPHPSMLFTPRGKEINVFGGLHHTNNTFNIYTNKGSITLNSTSPVVVSSLIATYTGGSAHVCVYDNGTLFSSEGACP